MRGRKLSVRKVLITGALLAFRSEKARLGRNNKKCRNKVEVLPCHFPLNSSNQHQGTFTQVIYLKYIEELLNVAGLYK